MQREFDGGVWRLGYGAQGASLSKPLELDVYSGCVDDDCLLVFEIPQFSRTDRQYLFMRKDGYIYERPFYDREDFEEKRFLYVYDETVKKCVFRNFRQGGYLVKKNDTDTGGFYVVGSFTGVPIDLKFIEARMEYL